MNAISRRSAFSLLLAGLIVPDPFFADAQITTGKQGATLMNDVAHLANQLAGHGYYLVVAQWELKEGNLKQALAIIDQYRPQILSADGVKIFLVAQDNEDPNHILFYEAYESEKHYRDHAASEAFQKYIIREGLSLVAKRTLNNYTLL